MTDTTTHRASAASHPTQSSAEGTLHRRAFVSGVAAAGAAIAVAPSLAQAGLSFTTQTDKAGLISIAGRITNSLGQPEKGAYVEIMQHRVRDWRPGATAASIEVSAWEVPEWLGVWTDDNGVFGLHTWWALEPKTELSLTAAPKQAEVRFNIETQDGRRLLRTMWLDSNPAYTQANAEDPTMLTPVAWDRRAETAQFVADFSVA